MNDDTGRISAEERIAHLERALDDLSDVVSAQSREIAHLSRRLEALLRREAEHGAETEVPVQRPPHW